LATVFDGVGYRLFSPAGSVKLTPKSILLIRLDQMGDVIQTLPFLTSIRKNYPDAFVTFLTTTVGKKILSSSGLIDEFIVWDCPWFGGKELNLNFWKVRHLLIEKKIDTAFDLRGDIRIVFLIWLAGIKNRVGFGSTGGGFMLSVCVPWNSTQHRIDLNLELIKSIGGIVDGNIPMLSPVSSPILALKHKREFRLAIHPDAGTPAKRWSQNKFASLIEKLIQLKFKIVLVGSDPEIGKNIENNIQGKIENKMGKTTLDELKTELLNSDGLLSNDSGPAHLMGALQKPVWVLWSGTADSSLWAPRGPFVRIFEHNVPCAPCSLKVCPVEGHPCLSEITENDGFDSIQKYFSAAING
jgi:heptosyltransferase-2